MMLHQQIYDYDSYHFWISNTHAAQIDAHDRLFRWLRPHSKFHEVLFIILFFKIFLYYCTVTIRIRVFVIFDIYICDWSQMFFWIPDVCFNLFSHFPNFYATEAVRRPEALSSQNFHQIKDYAKEVGLLFFL